MITLSKSGNTVTFGFENNGHYLYNGTIDVPVNSLSLITDDSEMATFKKSASNDIFISALYSDFGMTKSELESWYKTYMVGSTGGGGTGGTTPEEVQQMIDSSLTDYYDKDDSDGRFQPKGDYATSGDIESAVSGLAESSAVTLEIAEATSGKADSSSLATVATSGSYNDLIDKPTIPTVPTSNTAFTNDAGYITSDALSGYAESSAVTEEITAAVSGKADSSDVYTKSEVDNAISAATDDMATQTWVGEQGYLTEHQSLSAYSTTDEVNSAITESTSGKADTTAVTQAISEAVSGKVDISTYSTYTAATDSALANKQTTLTAGTGIDITDNVISATGGGGGGKAIEAGRGIAITTGATADTVSFSLPISATASDNSGLIFNLIDGGNKNEANGQLASAFGIRCRASGRASFAIGSNNSANGASCFAGGEGVTSAIGICSFAFGYNAETSGAYSVALGGYFLRTYNENEFTTGKANVSNTGSTDADKTLFSVGNGTSSSARHNAFEIRQNGDIYYYDGTNDVKLQDKFSSLDTTIGDINTILQSI